MLSDIRDYQILFLSLFLFLGLATRDWTLRLDAIAILVFTCIITQLIAVWMWRYLHNIRFFMLPGQLEVDLGEAFRLKIAGVAKKNFAQMLHPERPLSIRSAIITSLGLSLLLRADHYSTFVLAGIFAISSKFLLQFQQKHFFNPANFGIISALILTPDAWVSPGQWGEEWWYALLFFGTGGMILKRVGRWDTTAAFLISYAALEAMRNFWLGWTWDVYFHRLMSGSLLLFSLFMITDPRSIPNTRISRLIWAIAIAVLTFIFRNQFLIPTAVFWALFAVSPLTIVLDFLWSSERFNWTTPLLSK